MNDRCYFFVARPVWLAALVIPLAFLAPHAWGADPWTASQLISPEALHQQLVSKKGAKPLLIHVGFHPLYLQGHIPGSSYYGAGGNAQGLVEIKKRVEKLPRNKAIILYCGCCPWKQCPNIRPAFKALKEMGFTRLRVLSLPTSFATDWAGKGYPVERGQ